MAQASGNISLERALRWLSRFAEREWPLLLPVVLAFLALPRMILLLLTPRLDQIPQTMAGLQAFSAALPGWWTPLLFAVLLFGIAGGMALMALALLPQASVGEAIGLAARRLPAWIGLACLAFAALLAAVIAVMVVATLLGAAQSLAVVLTLFGTAVASGLMLLALPSLVVHRLGPIAAARAGWRMWHGAITRTLGLLALFVASAWVVGLALQVSLGSLLLLAGRLAGQPQLGQTLATLLASLVAAFGWGAFYLLVAALFRQRAGLD